MSGNKKIVGVFDDKGVSMEHNVFVFGLGFVGLTTALSLADRGHKVYGYDADESKRNLISTLQIPFHEPGLKEALERNLGRSFFCPNDTTDLVKADSIFICVGTPSDDEGNADLSAIFSVIDEISAQDFDNNFRVVVIKSTVPPSSTAVQISEYMHEKGILGKDNFGLANNPEFLREGHCWYDANNVDRIVCGVCDSRSENLLRSLYSVFNTELHFVSLNTAEFIKYLSNTLLATMISYANEMSIVADHIGDVEIKKAFEIIHTDGRWRTNQMKSYVYPGCGFGGYCLPKDIKALSMTAKNKGYNPQILNSVIEVNENIIDYHVKKIIAELSKNKKIGIIGLAFKPGSDDVRSSKSAVLINKIIDAGYTEVFAHDPISIENFRATYNNLSGVQYIHSLEDICKIVDVLVIATAWPEYLGVKKIVSENVRVIDLRYAID